MSAALRVAVIGGGISGLTAAFRLHQAGHDVRVFESSDRLGGQIKSEMRGGMLLEWGPDSLVAHKPAGERLCRELGLADELLRLPSGGSSMQVVHDGQLQQLPDGFLMIAPTKFGPLMTNPMLSPLGRARAALERFIPSRRASGDETIQQFVTRRWGRELYERVAEPVLGGLFSADATRLSANACIPRMAAMERQHGSVIAGIRQAQAEREKQSRPSVGVYALERGMSSLTEALAAALPPDAVRKNAPVESIQDAGDHWTIHASVGSYDVDAVILACPAFVAAKLLSEHDQEIADELSSIEYASCATVNLLYDATALAKPLRGFGFFVARSEGSPLLACNYTSHKFEKRAPSGCVMLRAFVGGAGREPIDAIDEGELVRIAHEGLARLLDLRGAPRFGRARRFPSAMPQMVIGSRERRERLARPRAGLALCGSSIGAVGLPDCIESAEQAIEQLMKQGGKDQLEQVG